MMSESTKKLDEFFENIEAPREYYRFDMIVPKEMFANGKNFPIYTPDWELDCVWEDERTLFPVGDVTGIMLVGRFNGKMRIALLVEKHMLNRFLSDLKYIVDKHGFDFKMMPRMVVDEVIHSDEV